MKYKFDVSINEKDYFDYNVFALTRSPYGKRQMLSYRIVITVIYLILLLINLYGSETWVDAVYFSIPIIIIWFLFQAFLKKFFVWSIKGQIKSMKKDGKMLYSPESVMEFDEDFFGENTPENKTEHKYSAIERISVIENKMIYIQMNKIVAYIIPFSCFESGEQYDDFVQFLKTKNLNVDFY